jgi:hypothetical protein
MSPVELVLLAIVGFFGGYGLAAWQNDAEERRRREDKGWSEYLRQALRGGTRK